MAAIILSPLASHYVLTNSRFQVTKGLQNGEAPKSGSGTLTVIKAGPGYHSQKTYNFGPEGVNTKTEEKTGKGVGNDMRE